ncbi:MAG: HD domain-containing protein [Thermoplasmata archaeon]|nr:HD domain-containing protein [Thermoplasmata archaeon]
MPSERTRRDLRLLEAIRVAVAAHEGTLRKDGRTPYIVHPVAVLRLLSSELGVEDPDILCAAVLHDVLEDTEYPEAALRRKFGNSTGELVRELTVPAELHGPSVPDRKKTGHLVREIGRMSWPAVLVKLCDRWDNLRDAANAAWSDEKRRSYAEQTRQILLAFDARWRSSPPPARLRALLKAARGGLGAQLLGGRNPTRSPLRGTGANPTRSGGVGPRGRAARERLVVRSTGRPD